MVGGLVDVMGCVMVWRLDGLMVVSMVGVMDGLMVVLKVE